MSMIGVEETLRREYLNSCSLATLIAKFLNYEITINEYFHRLKDREQPNETV